MASWAWCHGKIRWARLDTCRRSHEMPRDSSVSISANSVGRSTTTPLPITGHDVVVEDAARDQLEGVAVAADDDGVPGVVATLVAHDVAVLLGQQVDDLGLALVTPLGADDDGDGHGTLPGRVDGT